MEILEPLYNSPLTFQDYDAPSYQSISSTVNLWSHDLGTHNTYDAYDDSVHSLQPCSVWNTDNDSFHGLREPNWNVPTPPPDEMDITLYDVGRVPTDEWRHKCLRTWNSFDIMNWVIHEIKRCGENYENACMKSFRISGEELCCMTKSEFEQCDPNFGGLLYEALQSLKSTSPPYNSLPSFNIIQRPQNEVCLQGEAVNTFAVEYPNRPYGPGSDGESDSGVVVTERKPKRSNKPPGRPAYPHRRKKQEKKTGRLWEFIRDLLKNREYCPSLICWENYEEGVFRFVRSDKVAELWGTIKENPRMTYEKLSRAMRYYYRSKVLLPVLGRRLVYKFGPAATDWQTPNPNFRLAE